MSTEKGRTLSNVLQEQKTDRIAVRIPPTLKECIEEMAREDDRTMSQFVERMLRNAAVEAGKLSAN